MLTYFIEALRPVLAAGVLVLVTCSTSLAAPIADPYFDAPIIKMFWGSKQPSYQSDMDSVTPGSPHGAALHLFYLNAAFEDAGVSLDKSFRNWIEVYTSEGQETLYPEVVSFGKNASLRSAALRNPGYVNVFTHSGPTPARCAVGYAAAKRPFDSKKSQPHITAMTSPPKRFVLCHCSALVVTPPKLRHSIKP
ncbi:hypothetical protein [Pseudomonas sp. UBA7530]|uniref:hypothetical protein n=1 Tax=Pseudomonas sp. UBA7530 TaxID=1947341 RepID=UPI0025FC5262|nr:hypothetical protein [Pseudomonas sp. UBA7530]